MKTILKLTFVLGLLMLFPFCKGKSQKPSDNKKGLLAPINVGEVVWGIGKNIDDVLQDKNGHYWFATNGDGVYYFDGKNLKHITKKDGLCSDFVWSIQQDINGELWFSTIDGICNFNGRVFVDFTDTVKKAPYGKLAYTKGGIFFGHVNGICFYDGKTFTNFVIYPSTYSAPPNDMNRPYSIYSMLVDKKENIWFGTQSNGVCFYDGKAFSYLTDKYLAGYPVRTIFQDKQGNLWFGNNGGGLFYYDGKTLRNITEENGLENLEFRKGISNNKMGSLARVWSINEDKQGNIWIGTIDAGVWKYDGKKLINYTTKDGLAGNSIWKIYKDNNGELWFVTDGNSICKIKDNKFVKYEFY